MFRKYYLLACICSLVVIKNFAQVNLQTGSAVFSLPMFNWQDDKSRLHFSMSLNYNSGNGLKVNDVASNVGQGWNLMAGGVITRMQNGEPDDQYPNYLGDDNQLPEQNDDITKYPAGYLYNPDDVTAKGCPAALAKYPIFGDKNHIYRQKNAVGIDRELDYFAFNFNGKNGLFVLNKNTATGYLLGDSKVKIWYTLLPGDLTYQGKIIRTRISTFFIQDEDGLIYRFGSYQNNTALQLGLTRVLRTGYCDINGTQLLTQPHFKGGNVYYQSLFDDNTNQSQYPYTQTTNPFIVNSWYLTEVDDPFTNRQILLSYGYSSITDPAQISITYYQENDYSIIGRKATQSEAPELLGITFPDQHSIYCNYSTADRLDVKGEKVLLSVDIKYQGKYLSKYELKTSYFIFTRCGIPSSTFEKSAARLCLLSVKNYGVDLKADDNPYLFDYNLGSDNTDDFVPPYSFPTKDIWGFYNGTNSTDYNNAPITSKPLSQLTIADLDNNDCKGLCFLQNNKNNAVLNAKNKYAKNGLLRQIIYPTGGTLSYDYAQNTGVYTDGSTSTYVGGVHVSKTSSTDGGFSNGCEDPITTQYNYVLSDNSSSLWGIERPINTPANKTRNHYAAQGQHYTWSLHNLPVGSCSYNYQYPGIFYQEEKTSLKWTQTAMLILSDVLDIVSIFMEVQEVLTVISTGNPVALIIDIIFGIVDLILSCSPHPSKDYTSTVYYNQDLNSINPLAAQFKRVEIVPNTGDIGKTVETFTSSDDYPLWKPDNPDLLTWQRYGHWEYGLPELITTYDKDGNKIKAVEYDYDNSYIKHEFSCDNGAARIAASSCVTLSSCNCEVLNNVSQPSDDWYNNLSFNTANTGDLHINKFDFYSGRLNLTDVYERTFKPNSTQYLQTNTHYDYDNLAYYESNALNISKITTVQSNGDTTYKYIKYSGDFFGGTLDLLHTNNSTSDPVETVNSFKKPGGTENFLSDKVTEYSAAATGNILPSRSLEQRFNAPQSSINWYQGPGGSNPPYIQTQTFNYNANGNLTGIKDEGIHIVANIYDYADKYIVASVINTDPNLDKPAYTSFETTGFGGWILTGTAGYNTTKAITGSQSFNISSGINLKASGLNTSKPYKLSFWATSSGATVTTTGGSASLAYNGPSYNGYTYYEYNIAAGASAVTIAGTTTIDELRLYPKTARMRTTTYDALIGKTSECDENNRITYYEYDELGRLRFIKDETKNIVKMYEYNVVSNKQNGCPGTYSNHLITETFTKSNCASGYQGNPVTYTVPANKYTSSISQADADQQAENDINTTGQKNADNTPNACSYIYYNGGLSQTFYTQGCAVNQYGKAVTYSVPAKKYNSIISQAVVDQMEQDEIDANGQANANNPPNNGCINTSDPFYEADYPASTRCQVDPYGSHTGHIEALMTQVNPNCSNPPYGSSTWKDGGVNEESCPHDEGSYPCLNQQGYSTMSGQGVKIYAAGTIVPVIVTLNSSDANALLSGTVGGTNISLSGSGTHTQTFNVTVSSQGYLSWTLSLSGTLNMYGSYICSNIKFN